jgi:8-oxo-dGTP pyrophosphatase MutT (NUDIX family)
MAFSINKNIICNNCGKFGHTQKQCSEPITSLGIICLRVSDAIKQKLTTKLVHEHLFDIHKNIIIDIIDDANVTNSNNIEYLIIQRKHSLGYIEFIRGRYIVSDYNTILHLIKQMTPNEVQSIKTKEFKELWEEVWKKTSYNKLYIKEMEESHDKFNTLKTDNFFDQNFENNYEETEWGFPKGRRNPNEKNLKCALREFYEETGINKNNLIVLNKLFPIHEIFHGTNGVLYKHIYYIAIYNSTEDISISKIHEDQLTEVGGIQWKNVEGCINLFRPYHQEKKKVLKSLHTFILNNIK